MVAYLLYLWSTLGSCALSAHLVQKDAPKVAESPAARLSGDFSMSLFRQRQEWRVLEQHWLLNGAWIYQHTLMAEGLSS